MERFYKKSTADFYTLIFLLSLSVSTIALDYKYNQITYIRSVINDLIVYPIDRLSNLPRSFINQLIEESSSIKNLELELKVLEKENIYLKIKLQELKKNYKILGYSTTKINSYQLNIYLYPVYLSIMVCIASILMLNIGHNKPKVYYFLVGILISVFIYYINYLLNILIETQKIPLMFSSWILPFLLTLFCIIGLVRINEK